MDKNKLIELRKKAMALGTIGVMGLTSITGCGAKTNKDVSSNNTISLTTATTTLEETTVESKQETTGVQSKTVAEAIYKSNKEYFDEKQYTVEDLECAYNVLNEKYYNEDGSLIMSKVQVDRAFDVIRELVMPQRVNEMIQKYKDFEKIQKSGDLEKIKEAEKEYFAAVKTSKFYNYQAASLSNFIEVNEKNKDVREFANEYSKMMNMVTANLINGVSPVEILEKNFIEMRQAQTGNISDKSVYKNINNYLGHDTTTNDGAAFMVAAMYKGTADYLNTGIDGHFINVPVKNVEDNTKVEKEKVRIGYSYNEQILVNAYYLGDLVETKDILKAKKLIIESFQTMPFDTMCYRQEKVNGKYYYTYDNSKTYTK